MEFIHASHYVYFCDYHIVIVTKYRRPIFNEGIFAYLQTQLKQITEHYPMIHFKTVNHDQDHLHMQISIPPSIAVGTVVGLIKQNTARELKQKFPFVKQVYWRGDSVWSDGYFVSTVGANAAMIKAYIENQGKKDAGQIRFGFEYSSKPRP